MTAVSIEDLGPVATPEAGHAVTETTVRPAIIAAMLRRDLLATRRSKAVVIPMIAVPMVLLVLLPAGIGMMSRSQNSPDLSALIQRLPSGVGETLAPLNPAQQLMVLVLGYLVAPLFLVVPLMVSAALAADGIAGEKERRTLESLLHLPITVREIFISKILVAWIPSVLVSWLGFVAYSVTANIVAWPVMGRLFLPTMRWALLIFWLTPAVAALGLGVMVRVSSRASTAQEANQLGGTVIMPLTLAAVGQTTGLLAVDVKWVVVAGVTTWMLAALLIRGGLARFTRDRIASRL